MADRRRPTGTELRPDREMTRRPCGWSGCLQCGRTPRRPRRGAASGQGVDALRLLALNVPLLPARAAPEMAESAARGGDACRRVRGAKIGRSRTG